MVSMVSIVIQSDKRQNRYLPVDVVIFVIVAVVSTGTADSGNGGGCSSSSSSSTVSSDIVSGSDDNGGVVIASVVSVSVSVAFSNLISSAVCTASISLTTDAHRLMSFVACCTRTGDESKRIFHCVT